MSSQATAASGASMQPMKVARSDSYIGTHSQIEVAYRLRVLCGTSNPKLAQDIAKCLGTELCKSTVAKFNNGEINIEIQENVRGDDVYIIQPTIGTDQNDVNTSLMELLLLIHTLKTSAARRITAVVPMFAYSRQDRKSDSRVPISASVVAQLIQAMGVDRVMTVDLHCGQIQGFFRNMPLDNLVAGAVFSDYIKLAPWFNPATTVVVSPDAGGVERANFIGDLIKAHAIVTILKRRVEANQVESMQMAGEVKGFNCIIVDDMVDTGGTLIKACNLLKSGGAARVSVCVTHGILSLGACENLQKCDALDDLIVTDTIPQEKHKARCSKLTVLSVASLLSQAIERTHNEESVSSLFPKHTSKATPSSSPSSTVNSKEQQKSAFPSAAVEKKQ